MEEIAAYTKVLIQEIKAADGSFRHDNMTRTKCPQCGKFMLEVNGRHGKLLVCQDRACGCRETISRRTNARCPVCHKKMELVGKGDGQRFVCVCGHKEKMKAFEERRAREGKGVNKRTHQQCLCGCICQAGPEIDQNELKLIICLQRPADIPSQRSPAQ